MTVTFTSSGAVKLKAGKYVSADLTDTNYTEYINQAESFINVSAKVDGVDLVGDYASLDANTKKILDDAASSHAAIASILYDMSGYTRMSEAQTALDVNYSRLMDCIRLLKEKKNTDYMRDTALAP